MNEAIMKDSIVFHLIHSVLLKLLIFQGQSTLMCLSHPPHLNVDSISSLPGGAQLPINALLESILRHISAPGGYPGSPNVVVNINNLFCVTDSHNVQIKPCKKQVINVAHGDQVVNLENPKDLTKRSLQTKNTTTCDKLNGKNSRHCRQGDCDTSNSEQEQSDQPRIRPMPGNTEPDKSDRTPENGDIHLGVPALNIFIDGKPLTEKSKHGTYNEELSSKLFKEELRELMFENKNSVGKRVLCHQKDPPPCDQESVMFQNGMELTYEELEKIIDNVTEKPNSVKLIVPGGVTGPLSGYFQKVDNARHGQALVHGVCHLDNGLLVPLNAMLRILKLLAWLSEMDPDFEDDDVSKLLASVKSTKTDSIVDLLRCFVKSNKIQVALPGTSQVSFAQFEQEDQHIPMELLKLASVEILGFRIPYIVFRDKLVALCRESAD